MFRTPQALMLGLALLACGSPPPPVAAPPPEPPPDPEAELQTEPQHDGPPPEGHMPVRAGAYRLRMTAPCPQQQERTAKGRLTLKRISASELPGGSGADEGERSQRLLWGQTDLDVESLEACLGPRPGATKREPIHPNLLVEVLQWNGQSQRQVLLVAAEPKKGKGRKGAGGGGVAMWVEQSAEGHLSGVWSRWELVSQGEGRWEADLERAEPP